MDLPIRNLSIQKSHVWYVYIGGCAYLNAYIPAFHFFAAVIVCLSLLNEHLHFTMEYTPYLDLPFRILDFMQTY